VCKCQPSLVLGSGGVVVRSQESDTALTPTRGESEHGDVCTGNAPSGAASAQLWWMPSRALLQQPPDLLVDWTGLRVRAHAAGPERWWTMPCYGEAVGNCGGSRTQYWRANRLSELGI